MSTDQNNIKDDDNHSWSTWEELLLASAVKRHGFKNWDSVAMEVQTRSSNPTHLITAKKCRKKYQDLRCRFTTIDDGNHNDETDTLPWLEDLRQLRVAELKQEVQRYDVSILSLQLKIKRLESEREQSLKETDNSHGKPDPEDSEGERPDTDRNEGADEPVKPDGELVSGKSTSGENRSVNGSNSTAAKGENQDTGEADHKPVQVETGSIKPESESNEPTLDSGDSNVQSSVSLTRKRKRWRRMEIPSSSDEAQPETGEGSRDIKRIVVKSQPLAEVLEAIRSHKNSSLFERRLNSQESDKYKNTIKQHVDLETVKGRLEAGSYSTCNNTFYRDLFILFNNALVFFSKSSLESTTAHELRTLVSSHFHKQPKNQAHDPTLAHVSSPEPTSSRPIVLQPKPDLVRSDSLLANHKSSAPILVCSKRSSISTKPSSFNQKVEPKSENKKPSSNIAEEETMIKLKEMSVITGSRSLRRGSKAQSNSNVNKKANTIIGLAEKKKQEATGASDKKRRSAADFLRRIKKSSPGETVKSNSRTEKKKVNENVDKGKEKIGVGAGKKNEGNPSKRNVGRPSKKGSETNNKRGRESGGAKEVAASSKQPKKRTRR